MGNQSDTCVLFTGCGKPRSSAATRTTPASVGPKTPPGTKQRTKKWTRPGTKALERQVHELQGEVDTLRDQLKDAKARIVAETGSISEQPAARHLRRHPKKSSITTTDKENTHTAAASPVFKPPMDRPLAHNPLANDPPPEGHPAVTPFDPTKGEFTLISPSYGQFD
jgi:hypothetical protein